MEFLSFLMCCSSCDFCYSLNHFWLWKPVEPAEHKYSTPSIFICLSLSLSLLLYIKYLHSFYFHFTLQARFVSCVFNPNSVWGGHCVCVYRLYVYIYIYTCIYIYIYVYIFKNGEAVSCRPALWLCSSRSNSSLLLLSSPAPVSFSPLPPPPQFSRSRFLRHFRSDLTRSLLYLKNELGATESVLRTGFRLGVRVNRVQEWLFGLAE